jgi:hypothetical protein
MRLSLFVIVLPILALAAFVAATARPPQRLTAHEWGTFTSLQAEDGHSIGGINTDDEPAPSFVHSVLRPLLVPLGNLPPGYTIGGKQVIPMPYDPVTMRLETPVLYFHLPPESPMTHVNVAVSFRGGWLSQYYPDAQADNPGLDGTRALSAQTTSTLQWNDLQIAGSDCLRVGTPATPPVTTDPVWLAPRQVAAADLQTPFGEAEHFLFYRGVGHLDAPIRIIRHADQLQLHSNLDPQLIAAPLHVDYFWLVDIQPSGTLAFRQLSPLDLSLDAAPIAAQTPAAFAPSDYSAAQLPALRSSMQSAIAAEGLNTDEADALLNTWERSYFKSPGLRLFFMVPPTWTEAYLPLHIPEASSIRRAMVGRIEIVSAQQRDLLHQIATAPPADAAWLNALAMVQGPGTLYQQIRDGRTLPPDSAEIKIPQQYRDYIALGRFRNALLLDEQRRRPSAGLQAFITTYRLQGLGVN